MKKDKNILIKFIIFAVIGVLTSIALALITSEPRGIVFYSSLSVVLIIEFLFFALSINKSLHTKEENSLSATSVIIGYGLIFSLGVVMLLVIFLFWLFSSSEEGINASSLAGVILIVSMVFMLVGLLLYFNDLKFRKMMEKKSEHKHGSRKLDQILLDVQSFETDNQNQRTQVDHIKKKLYQIMNALSHSHGGGVGSVERKAMGIDKEQQLQLDERIQNISSIAKQLLDNQGDEECNKTLKSFQLEIKNIESILMSMRLY